MSWGSTLLLSLSQAAGVAGLILGIYNLWHGIREPVRAQQRELRREYLDFLYEVSPVLVEALAGISRRAVKEVPELLGRTTERKLFRLSDELVNLDPQHMSEALRFVRDTWQRFIDEPANEMNRGFFTNNLIVALSEAERQTTQINMVNKGRWLTLAKASVNQRFFRKDPFANQWDFLGQRARTPLPPRDGE
ncbi:hypothetical protein [Mycolicibacterium palauense]|uniref:hypothetical protein n=1 Tax=Mycolicibacterium palauense TaxID=2034511 RepID=UPI00159BA97A|nr:hypothetical protein [Mycolicibacterium palauense]